MKTYTTAIYALAALAIQDWASQAAATPMPEPLPDSPERDTIDKRLAPVVNETAYGVEAVALPEPVLALESSQASVPGVVVGFGGEAQVEEDTNLIEVAAQLSRQSAAIPEPAIGQGLATGADDLAEQSTSVTRANVSAADLATDTMATHNMATATTTAVDLSAASSVRYGLTALSISSPSVPDAMPEFAGQPQSIEAIAQQPGDQQAIAQQRIAQQETLPDAPRIVVPDPAVLEEAQTELDRIEEMAGVEDPADRSAPALTIANPSGFGVDRNTVFVSGTFQERTRYSDRSDGALGIGIGLGDSREAVGVELSYTIGSFGRNRGFGTGGFNAKVHRRFSESFSAAIGWNGFLITGEEDGDFEDSVYGSMTKIFRLRDDLDAPFSRLAVTAGAGTGQFRLEDDVEDDDFAVNPFGSVALRIVEPVSLITEWTGQDLAVGLSVNPFRNVNIAITPAVRDIAGAGDGPRFVLGFGASF